MPGLVGPRQSSFSPPTQARTAGTGGQPFAGKARRLARSQRALERLERAIEQGARLARRLGRLPRFIDWAEARQRDPRLLTEWQVYRLLEGGRGAWSSFQFLLRERLLEQGAEVTPDGRVRKP